MEFIEKRELMYQQMIDLEEDKESFRKMMILQHITSCSPRCRKIFLLWIGKYRPNEKCFWTLKKKTL